MITKKTKNVQIHLRISPDLVSAVMSEFPYHTSKAFRRALSIGVKSRMLSDLLERALEAIHEPSERKRLKAGRDIRRLLLEIMVG